MSKRPPTPIEAIAVSPKRGVRDISRLAGCAILILSIAAYAASWGATWDWRLDLATHFPVHLAIASLVATLLLLAGRAYRSAGTAVLFCALQIAVVGWRVWWGPASIEEGPLYQAVTANLSASNSDRDGTIAYLQESECDFIALQELTPEWRDALRTLGAEYPHSALYPRAGAFGIGLVSRRPILSQRLLIFAHDRFPSIEAKMKFENGEATIIVTHPPPPVGSELAAFRDAHLAAMAEYVRTIEGPILVVGDLNVTPWSPRFHDLLEESGLNDGRLGHGVQATWPASLGPLGIPIDHVLATSDIGIAELAAGPRLGSDHRPVRFAFRLAPAGAKP